MARKRKKPKIQVVWEPYVSSPEGERALDQAFAMLFETRPPQEPVDREDAHRK